MELKTSDQKLLQALQNDAACGPDELAERAGLSRTSCWRRIKEFEKSGLIDKRVTLLDPAKLNLGIHAFLSVSLVRHSDENGAAFESYVKGLPSVLQCFSVSGDTDYLLYVVARDMNAYADFLRHKILHHALVRSANSSFALDRIKYSTVLPLD